LPFQPDGQSAEGSDQHADFDLTLRVYATSKSVSLNRGGSSTMTVELPPDSRESFHCCGNYIGFNIQSGIRIAPDIADIRVRAA
jgi:hypothetical protein